MRTLHGSIMILVAFTASAASKLGPAALESDLRAQSESILHYIVRGEPTGLEAAKSMAKSDAAGVRELPLINGIFLLLREGDAESLARRSDISQVYYLRGEIADTYLHVIQGLAYAWEKVPAPGVANMSLGPPPGVMPLESDIDEPMNAATRKLAEKGIVVVIAAGNYFTPDNANFGVINPWCRVEWVICVGAASADANVLFEYSARGLPAEPATWPDLVANGIDVMSTWPRHLAKSPIQLAQDQSSSQWRSLLPDEQSGWAVMSGTSQAAAQVSRAAAQVIFFVRNALLESKKASRGSIIFSIDIPRQQFGIVSRRGQRLTGDVSYPSNEIVTVTYKGDEPWKVVKQILMDTATPMPEFRPEEVGAGFVSPAYIDAQFGQFNVGQPQILPIRIIP